MNSASYRLAVSMAACNIASAVAYTIGAMVGLNPIKNCHTTLAMGSFLLCPFFVVIFEIYWHSHPLTVLVFA